MKRKDIFYIMIIACLVILILGLLAYGYLREHKNDTPGGFNSELPDGKAKEMESSKSKAYEMIQPDDSSKHIVTLDEFEEAADVEEPEAELEVEEYFKLESEEDPQPIVEPEHKENKPDTAEVKTEIADTAEEKPQKREFITATSELTKERVEGIVAIAACIYQNQRVKDNGRIKIRVLEEFDVSGVTIDKGAILTGIARIENDRVKIDITSIKTKSNIVLAKLSVYDNDGQEGIFYPASQEENALKSTGSDITKRIGNTIGTSGVIGSVVNGGVDFLSEKASKRTITLYADYKIFLIKL